MSEADVFLARGGAGAYLGQVTRMLRSLGAEVHLFVAHTMPATWRKAPAAGLSDHLAAYDSVRLADSRLVGNTLWNRRLDPWLGLAMPGLRLAPVRDRPGWLPPMAPEDVAQLQRWLMRLAPDLVLANYFNAAVAFDGLPPSTARAILVHDVMALLSPLLVETGAQSYVRPEMVAEETAAFRAADLCLAIQDLEAAHIRQVAPETLVETIPHACTPVDGDLSLQRPPTVLFVGTAVAANIDALGWLLREIWPRVRATRPDARLRVVGTVGESWRERWPDGVEAPGFVSDISAEYGAAALSVAPIRFGSGLKVKLVESLAHGVPVVATPVGAAGIDGAPMQSLRVAADPGSFADAMIAMLGEADPADVRAQTRAFAAARYAPEAVCNCLAMALARVRDRIALRRA